MYNSLLQITVFNEAFTFCYCLPIFLGYFFLLRYQSTKKILLFGPLPNLE
jgi:hypothetical protein